MLFQISKRQPLTPYSPTAGSEQGLTTRLSPQVKSDVNVTAIMSLFAQCLGTLLAFNLILSLEDILTLYSVIFTFIAAKD